MKQIAKLCCPTGGALCRALDAAWLLLAAHAVTAQQTTACRVRPAPPTIDGSIPAPATAVRWYGQGTFNGVGILSRIVPQNV